MKKTKKKKIISRIGWVIVKIFLFLFCFTFLQVLAFRFIAPPLTPNVAWEWGHSIFEKKTKRHSKYEWRKIEDISPHLRRAVIAAEDQRFLSHRGFDVKEIRNALNAFFTGKKLRGASTISMQTARSVYLLSSNSIYRKLAEAYYTMLIELLWDKQRILEVYLNTVDWGTGVTGAQAACQKYYGIDARDLSAKQAAIMTAILPSPHIWSVKKPTPYIKKRQAQILRDMHRMPLL